MYRRVYALGMDRARPPKIDVYMPLELIAAIDKARGFQSRSDWMRQAARVRLEARA